MDIRRTLLQSRSESKGESMKVLVWRFNKWQQNEGRILVLLYYLGDYYRKLVLELKLFHSNLIWPKANVFSFSSSS